MIFGWTKKRILKIANMPEFKPILSQYFLKHCNIILTHYIGNKTPPHYRCFASPRSDISNFENDLLKLCDMFEFVSLQELIKNFQLNPKSEKPLLALTIDDGFDIYNDALLSLFKKLNIKPHVFLVTKYINNNDLMWRHKLSAIITMTPHYVLKQAIKALWPNNDSHPQYPTNATQLLSMSFSIPYNLINNFVQELWEACRLPEITSYMLEYSPYLSWEKIRYLQKEGFQFGSHSHTHPCFDQLSKDESLQEMQSSLDVLTANLGPDSYLFAYPFGRRVTFPPA